MAAQWGRDASQWSIYFTSLALWGWLNKACIFCTSLLQLGTPGTANNSLHQPGVSVVLAFHVTHLQSSHTSGSGGGPSSSELPADPLRKEVTPSSNSGSSPNSKSSAVTSPSSDSGLSQGGWQGVGLLVNHTWQCLLLLSVAPWIQWSLLFNLALTSGQLQGRGDSSASLFSPSRAAAAPSAFWWASLMGAKLFSIDVSLFLVALPFEGQASKDWGLAVALGVLSFFCPWQPLKEDHHLLS